MKNVNLNVGGFIGALLGLGIGAAILYAMSTGGEMPRRSGRVVILGVIGGGLLGNFLWGLIFSRNK